MIDVAQFLHDRYDEEEDLAAGDPCRCPGEFSYEVPGRVFALKRLVNYLNDNVGMDDCNPRGSHGMTGLLLLAQAYRTHPDFRPEWAL